MKFDLTESVPSREFIQPRAAGSLGIFMLAGCATLHLPKISKPSAGCMNRAKGQSHCAD